MPTLSTQTSKSPTNSGSPGPFLVLEQGSAGARLTPGLSEVERQPLRTPRKSWECTSGDPAPPSALFHLPTPRTRGMQAGSESASTGCAQPHGGLGSPGRFRASASGSPAGPRSPAAPGLAQQLSPLEEQPHGEDACSQREHRQHVPGARVAVAVGRALQVGPAHVLRQPEALAPQPAPQEAQGSRRRSRHLTPARRPPPPQPPRQPRPTEPAGKQPRGGARPTATLFRPRVLPAAQPASPAGLASSPPISPSRLLRHRRNPGTSGGA